MAKFKKYTDVEMIRDTLVFIILSLLFYHFELWKDIFNLVEKITNLL